MNAKYTANTKHTAGPWSVDLPYGEPGTYVQASDTSLVCRVFIESPDEKRHIANAYLIAAAPDLLKACDEADTAFACLNLCDGLTPQAHAALRDAWALVNHAMAKAKNRPDHFAEENPEVSAAALAKHS